MTDVPVKRSLASPLSRRRFLQASAVAAAAASIPLNRAARAGGGCDVFDTPAEFMGVAPAPEDVLGFEIGVDREVTSDESNAYLEAVAAASPRVITDVIGTTPQGRDLRYAIVGRPSNVTPAGLAAIRQATAKIRDPETSASEAATLAETTPAILWIVANVHGNEESGADASLQTLFELADRDDCVVRTILKNAIVVLLPVQNPDGRELETRRNAYGFDLNRDTHVRTQVETDTRVELIREYPPILFMDDHEFGFYRSFFPPNNDPQYHEVDEKVIGWHNQVYGKHFADAFEDRGWDFFNGSVYDFFAPQFGDTLAANGFNSAGMTIEVYNGAALHRRYGRHLVVQWVGLWQAVTRKATLLEERHKMFVRALAQGRDGVLEPNKRYFRPDKPVQNEVDPRPVRHYFFPPAAGKEAELQRLIRRLQRMDVVVRVLDGPLRVPNFRPYGRAARTATLPAGTFWVSMAQAQKHWIQAVLNEDTYIPTKFTFSLSGWSLALLANVGGGLSGDVLHPSASVAPPMPEPAPPALRGTVPRVGLFRMSKGTTSYEGYLGTTWLFDHRWQQPYEELQPQDVIDGALDDIDVLVSPPGGSSRGLKLLKAQGRKALVDWVNAGGRYVGYRFGGARLAALLGLSTARLHYPFADVPGTLLRARVDTSSPLSDGVGPFAWVLFDDDLIAKVDDPDAAALSYPHRGDPDWFASGYIDNPAAVDQTAACVDEFAGAGRVVIFPSDPNRRAMPDGMQHVLWNAIYGPDPAGAGRAAAIGSAARATAERKAKEAARALPAAEMPLRFTVPVSDEAEATKIVRSYRLGVRKLRADGVVRFLVENPAGYTVEEHPFAIEMAEKMRRRGLKVRGFRGP